MCYSATTMLNRSVAGRVISEEEAKKLSSMMEKGDHVENLTNQELIAQKIKLFSNFFMDVEAIIDGVFNLIGTKIQ